MIPIHHFSRRKLIEKGFEPSDYAKPFFSDQCTFEELFYFLKDLENECYFPVKPHTEAEVRKFLKENNLC